MGKVEERRKIWNSSPKKESDIFAVFEAYLEGRVARLPWCETPVHLETIPLREALKKLNRRGFLTINSQPRVNGVPSTDTAVGWGGPGGYVYQKAYLEFFTSEKEVEKIAAKAAEFKFIAFTAVDRKGKVVTSRKPGASAVNAVTWGVFPDREIIQPTVVDHQAFIAWKDEAFALWASQWQSIYPEGSVAWKLIQSIMDTWYLVNVVDNDYVSGDIFAFFEAVLAS